MLNLSQIAIIGSLIVSIGIICWAVFGIGVRRQRDLVEKNRLEAQRYAKEHQEQVAIYNSDWTKIALTPEEFKRNCDWSLPPENYASDLEKSLEARKAKVARRRPLQVKLGRVF